MNTNKKSKFLTLNLALFLFVSNQSLAQATSQSVCINKKTGVIRVSEICEQNESKGTRKVTAPVLTKVEKLQKKVNDLEAQIMLVEKERKDFLEDIRKSNPVVDSLDAFYKSINDCRSTPDTRECSYMLGGPGVLMVSLDKQHSALVKTLGAAKFSLEKELKGYKTITCRKGSEVLSITDAKPKCPKGYK